MAEKIISAGVFTRENDQSFLQQGIGAIGAAIIGPFKKGPAFLPTIVNTQSEFEQIFGTPDGSYYTGYSVSNYLKEAGPVTIVRVGHTGGYSHLLPVGITVSGSVGGQKLISSLLATATGDAATGYDTASMALDSQPSASVFNISGSDFGSNVSSSVLPSAVNDIADVFGKSASGAKNVYAYNYFENAATQHTTYITTSGSQVTMIQLATQDFTNDISYATTPWVQSQLISSERYNLCRFHTLGDGGLYNKEYKVSIYNVKAATTTQIAAGNSFPTFSILVREYSDIDKRPTVVQQFNSVNMNPASPNYIAKVIGDQNRTIDSLGKITENGDYKNNSKYIRVEVATEGSYPDVAAPFAHAAYTNPIYVGSSLESIVPVVLYATGSDSNTSSISTKFSGIDLETSSVKVDNGYYLNPTPANATVGANTAFAFDAAVNAIVGGVISTINLGYTMSGSANTDVNKRQFTLGFQGGFDGCAPTLVENLGSNITAGNSQGFSLSTSTSSGSVAYVKAINAVSNPDDYDINLVSAPGVIRRLHSYVFDKIVDMVEAREDAFFIGDVTSESDTIAQAIAQADLVDSNYTGTYYPWVKTIDVNTNKLTSIPPSVLMPGIYAANDAIAAEWFAPAGLNRGGVVGATSVLNRLTKAERDELYENKVNPIAAFPGEGIVAFGQKTLQTAASALDRINVRRLLIKVKKYIASTSRYLVFEQNTAITRNKFLNTVNPYMESVQQRQGVYAFKVVMDETNNTPDVIDRNIMAGQIFLQPTKTAEFIVLDFNIMPTGASFSG